MNDCQQAHQAIVIYCYRFLGMREAFSGWLSIRISPGTGSSFCAMFWMEHWDRQSELVPGLLTMIWQQGQDQSAPYWLYPNPNSIITVVKWVWILNKTRCSKKYRKNVMNHSDKTSSANINFSHFPGLYGAMWKDHLSFTTLKRTTDRILSYISRIAFWL